MQIAVRLLKSCLLVLIGMSIAVLWIYFHGFFPTELASRGVLSSTAERAAGIATLIVLFAAPAMPICRLFPRRSMLAAILIGWIPLALSVTLAYQVDIAIPHLFAISFAFAEGGACWLTIMLGVWTVRSLMLHRSGHLA
jgi:hypothetical protein